MGIKIDETYHVASLVVLNTYTKFLGKIVFFTFPSGSLGSKSPCREGRSRLLKDKTHRLTTPSGIHSSPRTNYTCAPRWVKMRENIPEGVVGQ